MAAAPGAPGIEPHWTSSAKAGVGTALSSLSRVWFTLSHGILNEIYFPRVDQACTRDFGLLVADGVDFFSEEKRDTEHQVFVLEDGVPAFRLINRCPNNRYEIEKQVVSDPKRDVILQRVIFRRPANTGKELSLYALLAPHLVNGGSHNSAWLGQYKGLEMLFAEGDGSALALACSVPWRRRSVGFVGCSDGWQDVSQHFGMTWSYDRADNGNVALIGEINDTAIVKRRIPSGEKTGVLQDESDFVLALAFGRTWSEAAFRARASLQAGFSAAAEGYSANWRAWQKQLLPLDADARPGIHNVYRVSTAVLRTHESPEFPGGIIASLSIPWGSEKGDDDLGGYHLIWPRDLAETAGALLAAGAHEDARRVLAYFEATQESDGHWAQNLWLDGTPYWGGTQMDECAFPILIVDLARREGALDNAGVVRFWPMVKRAASYILCNGPVTGQDRWEEDGGYSPFTIAVEIAGLLAAADLAELNGSPSLAQVLRDTADAWNAEIEWWTYAQDTQLARQANIRGYYVRITPPQTTQAASPISGFVPIKNRPPQETDQPATAIVSPDALALVRFGLRSAHDPRISDTVAIIDRLLKVELPNGPCWRRYNGDGYGEHTDGSAFDGTGVGRAWPLLTGERAHFELAAGRAEVAMQLLETLESQASPGALLPEQVWDSTDIDRKELWAGKPTGSAMPLVWAHAEHIKLRRSLADGRVFDMPPQTVLRYQVEKRVASTKLWRMNNKASTFSTGLRLRLELVAPCTVRFSLDNWHTMHDLDAEDTGIGLYLVTLPTEAMTSGQTAVFTFFMKGTQSWNGTNFSVTAV